MVHSCLGDSPRASLCIFEMSSTLLSGRFNPVGWNQGEEVCGRLLDRVRECTGSARWFEGRYGRCSGVCTGYSHWSLEVEVLKSSSSGISLD